MGALTVADLVPGDAEPRIKDLVLAERLGFKQPRDIRDIVRLHRAELEFHGILRRIAAKTKPGRGRPELQYHLNEMQALLVCMWARTPKAAQVRADVARVFVAYRRGQLLPTDESICHDGKYSLPNTDPMAAIADRNDIIQRLKSFQPDRDGEELASSLVHLLPPAGDGVRLRFPPWFYDTSILAVVCRTHRRGTLDQVRAILIAEFGQNAPSRGSLGRFWLRLDGLYGTGRRLR